MTRRWWRDIWDTSQNPMASEYLRSDAWGLLLLGLLVNRYWEQPATALASEIRLASEAFGLGPTGRRRLQLVVQKVDAVTKRHQPPPIEGDPRAVLRPVR